MNCKFEGVIIRSIKKHTDERGWLKELTRQDELTSDIYPMMSYVTMTKPGIVRGPHEHCEQTDCFCFVGPSTFRLQLWDNRKGSATFGQQAVFELGEENPAQVIVPNGVVHAYRNIGTVDGIVYNAPNKLYAGPKRQESVDEIRHEDDPDSPFSPDK